MAPPLTQQNPYTVTDEKGDYTVFPGKHCMSTDCGVALTSRNRYDRKLLCAAHGREKNRLRPAQTRKRKSKAIPPSITTDPRKLKAHHALSFWLSNPTMQDANVRLKVALVDFELHYRFTHMELPPPRPHSIPVEDPGFSKPEHRTTRAEFLYACNSLGV